ILLTKVFEKVSSKDLKSLTERNKFFCIVYSNKKLANILNVTNSTVLKAKKDLVEYDLLYIEKFQSDKIYVNVKDFI
ncbi:hypothetical protein Q0M30_17395, partial [Staphylococcus aureus]|nr:hypothetical protein [Staphylococcus aureus]